MATSEAEAGSPPAAGDKPKRSWFWRLVRGAGVAIAWLVLALLATWSTLAIYFSDLHGKPFRSWQAAVFVVLILAAVVVLRGRRWAMLAVLAGFLCVLGWWFSLSASNDRAWQADVTQVPWAEFEGDQVTVHNIRNCDYRSETDFTPQWYDRTFDLSKLARVDYLLTYWGSPAIAHAMLSFEFSDGNHLAVSIETRKVVGQDYSALQGFFRQYELIYVVSDERDVIRLRTNYRDEDVYLYRLRMPQARARAVLTDYLRRVNELKEHPQFYNALTDNCVTNVLAHARATKVVIPWHYSFLFSGYSDQHLYSSGALDQTIPFEQLKAASHIDARGKAADQDPLFSQKIREGLPCPPLKTE